MNIQSVLFTDLQVGCAYYVVSNSVDANGLSSLEFLPVYVTSKEDTVALAEGWGGAKEYTPDNLPCIISSFKTL